MKIGVVCPYNLFIPGGVQSHVTAQVAELKARGHEVRIITPRPQGHTDDPPEGVIFIGHSTRIKAQKTWADVSASVDTEAIEALLTSERFDLVHIHEPLIPLLGAQLLPKLTCPIVGTFHAAMPDTIMTKSIAGSIGMYKRSIMKYLNAVTAVSEAATGLIKDELPAKEITIIPNGIDLDVFSLGSEPREAQTFLYVGRLEKRKGVMRLLEAFAELQQMMPGAKLIIAGDGPRREALEAKRRQLRLSGVQFLGFVSEIEKIRLLRSCRVFTSPATYGESFGIVLLEAMACGAVTVAGDNPGYESVMTQTGRLSLVDTTNEREFARRLVLMATDDGLRRLWLDWAAQRVQDFSYASIVDQYERLYKELAAAKR